MIKQARADLRAKARELAGDTEGRLDYCELWKHYTPEMVLMDRELWARDMVISCVCYGREYNFYDERTGRWGQYGLNYEKELGAERALEVFRDQVAYMRKHATINSGVYTDHEGCTYNSINWS